MIRTNLVLIGLLLTAMSIVPAPSAAHACSSGEGCNGHHCPDDGTAHYHSDGVSCWAIPTDALDHIINLRDAPIPTSSHDMPQQRAVSVSLGSFTLL